jgi:hypothetical protein
LLGVQPPIAGADPATTLALFAPEPEEARRRLILVTTAEADYMQARRGVRDADVLAVARSVSTAHGIAIEDVIRGSLGPGVAKARAAIIRHCTALGMSDSALTKALAISARTIRRHRT